jgi:hypothetical protein
MTTLRIDPRRQPIRGCGPIGEYLGLSQQIAYREILKGTIIAWKHGMGRRALWISTPEKLDQSPLVTGQPPAA